MTIDPTHPATTASEPWAALRLTEPELAGRIRARFDAHLHHVLGTLRPDGAPRLSGTEVTIDDERVTLGMMGGSRKLEDVRRDPRVELHSAPLEADMAEGDARLGGLLRHIGDGSEEHPGATFFELQLTFATLLTVEDGGLVFRTWRPVRGVRVVRRS
jgi:hypothetical protein